VPKQSAGLLLYRRRERVLEVFLVHPGGPLWARKDEWSIAKGEFEPGEDPLTAARREFHEETGCRVEGPFHPLAPVRQPGGKVVFAWAVEGDLDPASLCSNSFTMEWPRGSGRVQEFPEVDRGAWFPLEEARQKIFRGQENFIDQLLNFLI
jgi:predicted NUDIX family NTP pyrophosphohydrolase